MYSIEDDNPIKTEPQHSTTLHTPTILFHHSNTEINRLESSTGSARYISPADVYDKSPEIIRKTHKIKQTIEELPAKKVTWGENTDHTYEKSPGKLGIASNTHSVEKAFTNVVKERNNPIVSVTTELPEENRIVSKFKSSRVK